MATDKKRHICKYCGIKSIETKMVFNDFWFHLKCQIDSDSLGTESVRCPQLLNDFEKCPYDLKVSELYSTLFWIEMRVLCPLTFIEMMFQRHNLIPHS